MITVCNTIMPSMMTPIQRYIDMGDLSPDPSEAPLVKIWATEYTMIRGNLYKKAYLCHVEIVREGGS